MRCHGCIAIGRGAAATRRYAVALAAWRFAWSGSRLPFRRPPYEVYQRVTPRVPLGRLPGGVALKPATLTPKCRTPPAGQRKIRVFRCQNAKSLKKSRAARAQIAGVTIENQDPTTDNWRAANGGARKILATGAVEKKIHVIRSTFC